LQKENHRGLNALKKSKVANKKKRQLPAEERVGEKARFGGSSTQKTQNPKKDILTKGEGTGRRKGRVYSKKKTFHSPHEGSDRKVDQ